LAYFDITHTRHAPWSPSTLSHNNQLHLRIVKRRLPIPETFKKISNVQFIAWQPKMFWNDSIISIAGIDICLAASGETRLSFQFDPEEKIMAFDWRKVLTKISKDPHGNPNRPIESL
jgi:hypothetical protein